MLAVPFLVTVAALRGLTVTLPIFHSSDELVYHYPLIKQFASQLPFPDLAHYAAAQTPLFHLLLAYVGKLIGYELWRLRLVNVLISYGLALAVYWLLHGRLGLGRMQSLALTLLFALSPYVYGSSFRVVTDNLATLFVVLSLERFERFRETGRLGPFIAGAAALAAAMLTRQSTAFMLPVAALYALHGGRTGRDRALALAAVVLAAVPVGALFATWHGLVAPGGDPSSCGLCAPGRSGAGASQGQLVVQSSELTLATIGLYGTVLFAPLLVPRLLAWCRRPDLRATRGAIAGASAGALLLLLCPAAPGTHAAGAIWNAAARFPTLLGSSLVFWLLVPTSGAILSWRMRLAPRRWMVAVFLGCFLVGALAIRFPWQKYVDPFALLALLLTVRRDEFRSPRELAGAGLLAIAFVAYAVDYSAHRDLVPTRAAARAQPVFTSRYARTGSGSVSKQWVRPRQGSTARGPGRGHVRCPVGEVRR